jgi:hypothetical protein
LRCRKIACFAVSEEFVLQCLKNSCFEEKLVFMYTQYKLLFDIILVYKKI